MNKASNGHIAFEVISLLGMLALFCVVTRIWPLLFLVVPGILIAAVRLLFISVQTPQPVIPETQPAPQLPVSEQDVLRVAYGVLQRRITEQVTGRYPVARWIWNVPNAMDRFAQGLPLTVVLSQAGGYKKAEVQVHNLQFRGLLYESVIPEAQKETAQDTDDKPDAPEDAPQETEPADYSLLAFEWCEANLLRLNDLCNAAIAGNSESLLIPADMLPHEDSWEWICQELTRNGFPEAVISNGGIQVGLPMH
jgi:hypothetical protein